MLQAVNGILTRQPGSTLYHPIHGSRGAFGPTYRASVSSSDGAHLLVVIRAIHAAADSLEPPDCKPAGEGDGGGLPQPSCLSCFCLLGDLGRGRWSHNRQSAPELWQLAFYRGLITGSEEQPPLK